MGNPALVKSCGSEGSHVEPATENYDGICAIERIGYHPPLGEAAKDGGYGYSPEAGANSGSRVADVLRMLASRLKEQRQAGSRYYIGDALTAVDIYSATSMAMVVPLPPEQCQMDGPTRAAFESRDPQIEAALDPILFQHRDMIFAERLEPSASSLR